MRIAILHYHLRPGGVTRVIENAVQALEQRDLEIRCAVITGEPYGGGRLERTAVVSELGYADASDARIASVVADLKREAERLLGGPPDLWHIHNHSLGKTPVMPAVVKALAEAGEALLLQIHDFAEDGRPGNYAVLKRAVELSGGGAATFESMLYPYGERVRYAVLNGRDFARLREAGLPEDRLYLLPNAVHAPVLEGDPHDAMMLVGRPRMYLYPTRAIRRKNMGEMVLWAALVSDDITFASTLAPANPKERPHYDAWVAFAKERGLPAVFGLGEREGVRFGGLLEGAEAIVSTSVAEGFGLAFLEPWLFGKGLVGRNLPEITRDFADSGVRLGANLYECLQVPVEWCGGREVIRGRIEKALGYIYESYGLSVPEDAAARALSAFVEEERVDFGRLDEPLQRVVIDQVVAVSAEAARAMIDPGDLGAVADRGQVEANRERIEEVYSLDRYGEHLSELYSAVAESDSLTTDALDPDAVLRAFLRPENLYLLRT